VSYLGWNSSDRPRLQKIGCASIVVALLDIAMDPLSDFITPGLDRSFVGKVLGLSDVGSDVHYMRPVPPECIEAIWQPGNPEYDRHSKLPRR